MHDRFYHDVDIASQIRILPDPDIFAFDKAAELEAKFASLESGSSDQLGLLKEELAKKESALETLKLELSEAKAEVGEQGTEMKTQLEAFAAEKQALQQTFDDTLEAEKSRCAEGQKKLEEQLGSVTAQLQASEMENKQKLDALTEQHNATVQTKEQECATLQQEVETLRQAANGVSEAAVEANKIREECEGKFKEEKQKIREEFESRLEKKLQSVVEDFEKKQADLETKHSAKVLNYLLLSLHEG